MHIFATPNGDVARLSSSVASIQQSSIALFVTTLLFFVVKAHKSSSSRFREARLPPGPKPLPVIGNKHQLVGLQLLHVVLHELAKTYGPIFRLKVGGMTLLSVMSSAMAREILKTQELRFAQRLKLPVLEMTSFDQGSLMFAPYSEYWKQLRALSSSSSPTRKRKNSRPSFAKVSRTKRHLGGKTL